jgi:hypothetical protein
MAKMYDKPQHIPIVDVHEEEVQRLDRDAFRRALEGAGMEVPKLVAAALERGRFDEDAIALYGVMCDVVGDDSDARAVLSALIAGKFQTTEIKRTENTRWEWAEPTDERVAPEVRSAALSERARMGPARES